MVVDRRALAGAPDEADHREALARIDVQQVLLVALGIGLGECIGQPVVMADQVRKQGSSALQQRGFVGLRIDQRREIADEGAQAVETEWNGHGTDFLWPSLKLR
ncbi:hypothetical protein D3C76_979470 [compost metagenome]